MLVFTHSIIKLFTCAKIKKSPKEAGDVFMASEVKAWGGVWGRVTERTRPVEEARKHLDLRDGRSLLSGVFTLAFYSASW